MGRASTADNGVVCDGAAAAVAGSRRTDRLPVEPNVVLYRQRMLCSHSDCSERGKLLQIRLRRGPQETGQFTLYN